LKKERRNKKPLIKVDFVIYNKNKSGLSRNPGLKSEPSAVRNPSQESEPY